MPVVERFPCTAAAVSSLAVLLVSSVSSADSTGAALAFCSVLGCAGCLGLVLDPLLLGLEALRLDPPTCTDTRKLSD